VCATLIGWVVDRRRDFAIMKALGASERLLTGFFAAEGGGPGAVGRWQDLLIGSASPPGLDGQTSMRRWPLAGNSAGRMVGAIGCGAVVRN